jgi:hypothetical protein
MVGRSKYCRGDPARSLSHGYAVVRPSSHQKCERLTHSHALGCNSVESSKTYVALAWHLVITDFASRSKLGCMKLEFPIPRFIAESAYCVQYVSMPAIHPRYGRYIDFLQTLPLGMTAAELRYASLTS